MTMAIAPLTGCKIIKLPYTIVKSVATDVGDAVGLVDKEKPAKDSSPMKTDKETSSGNIQPTEVDNSLGAFYVVWALLLLAACMALFIIKNKNRKNRYLKPPTS